MGIGDELMMAGEARRRAGGDLSKKYGMLDKLGAPRWHPIWDQCEHIARPGQPCVDVIGYTVGRRPYVVSEDPVVRVFKEYEPMPAKLKSLGPQARAFADKARGAVVFNPTIKHNASPNKDWGWERWRQLIKMTPEIRWVQVSTPGVYPRLHRNVEILYTGTFWDACGAMTGARAAVVHEGALHHAAAALDVPTIVIRGGYIAPSVTGYAGQVDMYVDDPNHPLGCGMRVRCEHCADAMTTITPTRVAAALRAMLKEKA